MGIENDYARVIFEKLFAVNPKECPKDLPVKDGKFQFEYSGTTLEVTVRLKNPSASVPHTQLEKKIQTTIDALQTQIRELEKIREEFRKEEK